MGAARPTWAVFVIVMGLSIIALLACLILLIASLSTLAASLPHDPTPVAWMALMLAALFGGLGCFGMHWLCKALYRNAP